MLINNSHIKLFLHLIHFYIEFHDAYYKEMEELVSNHFRSCLDPIRSDFSRGEISEDEFNSEIESLENEIFKVDDLVSKWRMERKNLMAFKKVLNQSLTKGASYVAA